MFTLVVVYYLNLKQKFLMQRVKLINSLCFESKQNLQNLFCKLQANNRKYIRLFEEVSEYKPFFERCLTIYLTSSMLVISCCTYMLFMTDSALQYKILFTLIDTVHIVFISLVIYFCSKLPSGHSSMSNQYYYFLYNKIRKQNSEFNHLFKVCSPFVISKFDHFAFFVADRCKQFG